LVSNYNVTINPGTLTVLTPSVITTVQDGANVLIVGTNGCDTIAVNATNPSAVTVNGTGSYSVGAGGHVIVYGMACDDNISLTGNVNLESHGGDGNDAISGGAGHDVLWGDQGNDTLTGAAGNDVLIGGDGSDRLVGSAGHDILVAGDLQGHNYDSLRTISDNWAANWIADGDLGDNNNDGDVVDEDADQLTGSSGHDWFIIGSGDKITDINSATKDGDKITNI
jgi:Ca2+-binding RTX toxin-like protein